MYQKVRTVTLKGSVSAQIKNLQVVSFDADWKEVYIGCVKKDSFTAICPNNVPNTANVHIRYKAKDRENAIISCAKWCPMETCTLLVLGTQYGIQLHDWDGGNLIYEYDFKEHGISVDEREVIGQMARGIAALGSSYIAVGLHTGEILVFNLQNNNDNYLCWLVGQHRNHIWPISDLASSTTQCGKVLASGDSCGVINLWTLEKTSIVPTVKLTDWAEGFPVTTICIWNRLKQGVVVAGFGSGHIRMFDLPMGNILCEITAHAGWITGMDLASHSGLLLTASEDGYVRVWQLSTKGPLVEHWFSCPVKDSLMVGAKFLDPRGSAFSIASYDSNELQIFAM